jgi:hypothetical protein
MRMLEQVYCTPDAIGSDSGKRRSSAGSHATPMTGSHATPMISIARPASRTIYQFMRSLADVGGSWRLAAPWLGLL